MNTYDELIIKLAMLEQTATGIIKEATEVRVKLQQIHVDGSAPSGVEVRKKKQSNAVTMVLELSRRNRLRKGVKKSIENKN